MAAEDRPWRHMIVRDRMEVDRQFAERVRQSGFSNQEWDLVMTAVEFEIRGDGDDARLVADTSKVASIIPELERIQSRGPAGPADSESDERGIVGRLTSALGFGGGRDEERLDEATELADSYADALQSRLEANGKWEQVRQASG